MASQTQLAIDVLTIITENCNIETKESIATQTQMHLKLLQETITWKAKSTDTQTQMVPDAFKIITSNYTSVIGNKVVVKPTGYYLLLKVIISKIISHFLTKYLRI